MKVITLPLSADWAVDWWWNGECNFIMQLLWR